MRPDLSMKPEVLTHRTHRTTIKASIILSYSSVWDIIYKLLQYWSRCLLSFPLLVAVVCLLSVIFICLYDESREIWWYLPFGKARQEAARSGICVPSRYLTRMNRSCAVPEENFSSIYNSEWLSLSVCPKKKIPPNFGFMVFRPSSPSLHQPTTYDFIRSSHSKWNFSDYYCEKSA